MSPFAKRFSLKSILRSVDPVIIFCMLALTCMSLLTVIGGAEEFGRRRLIMQLAMNAAGLVATFVIAHLDYQDIGDRFALPFFFFSIGFLCLVFVPGLGLSEGTNQSWVNIPIIDIGIQPSEFVKASFIMTFARHLYTVRDKINHPKSILALGVHAGAIIGLILGLIVAALLRQMIADEFKKS